jgi:hypothetical protein
MLEDLIGKLFVLDGCVDMYIGTNCVPLLANLFHCSCRVFSRKTDRVSSVLQFHFQQWILNWMVVLSTLLRWSWNKWYYRYSSVCSILWPRFRHWQWWLIAIETLQQKMILIFHGEPSIHTSCACPKTGTGFQTPYFVAFLCSMIWGEKWLFFLLTAVDLLAINVLFS